jgi:hypothetical protein
MKSESSSATEVIRRRAAVQHSASQSKSVEQKLSHRNLTCFIPQATLSSARFGGYGGSCGDGDDDCGGGCGGGCGW